MGRNKSLPTDLSREMIDAKLLSTRGLVEIPIDLVRSRSVNVFVLFELSLHTTYLFSRVL